MRKITVKISCRLSVLFFLVFLLPVESVVAQNKIGFGLFADPVISWFSTDTKAVQNSGARTGFNFGITFNKYFANNYAFSTGISILSAGGTLKDTSTVIYFNSYTMAMPANQPVVYKIQYVNVPIGLKFKSNQIGYLTIFSDVGIDPKVVIGGKFDIDGPVNFKGESAMNELNRFNLAYHIMAGIEYSLGGTTAIVLGLGFEDNFLDVTKDNPRQTIDKVTQKIMKFRFAQLNYHIGNFAKNKELICNAIQKAKSEGSELVVFSELSVPGYPPLDLLDHIDFVNKCEATVLEIAKECTGIAAIVGAPTINKNPEGKKLFNSALVLSEGEIIFSANKALLPTYDIFDEYRYFEPEKSFGIFSFKGINIALTICEDLWDEQPFDNGFEKSRLYTISPMDVLSRQNPEIIINISSSPFSYTRIEARRNIFRNKAKKHNIPVVMVNQTGANTELIFDGASMIINRNGEVCHQLPFFEETVQTFTLEEILGNNCKSIELSTDLTGLVHQALITGIRDYFSKVNFKKAILGVSGGIDSAVCLSLAVEALGAENVLALLLPSRYSSEHSVSDAVRLSSNLNVRYETINIEKPFSAFEDILSPIFMNKERDVTEENLQARIRSVILMAISNKSGYILLNTSNKSEAAVGYGTLYGDMAGGISIIGDVYKTDVYKLAAHINRNSEIIPRNIMTKPPSAELRPDQFDTDSLPEYEVLDSILYQYIELQKPESDIVSSGYDSELVTRVLRMINSNEYKRYQAPPVLRISSKAFGAGRRMPLAAKY